MDRFLIVWFKITFLDFKYVVKSLGFGGLIFEVKVGFWYLLDAWFGINSLLFKVGIFYF